MADDRAALSRMLAWVASDLDERAYPFTGPVRQAARLLVELPTDAPEPMTPKPTECRRCGVPLVQAKTGRPRRWCSDRCRKRGGIRS